MSDEDDKPRVPKPLGMSIPRPDAVQPENAISEPPPPLDEDQTGSGEYELLDDALESVPPSPDEEGSNSSTGAGERASGSPATTTTDVSFQLNVEDLLEEIDAEEAAAASAPPPPPDEVDEATGDGSGRPPSLDRLSRASASDLTKPDAPVAMAGGADRPSADRVSVARLSGTHPSPPSAQSEPSAEAVDGAWDELEVEDLPLEAVEVSAGPLPDVEQSGPATLPSQEPTRAPPPVNPAGPVPREPFPLAESAEPPKDYRAPELASPEPEPTAEPEPEERESAAPPELLTELERLSDPGEYTQPLTDFAAVPEQVASPDPVVGPDEESAESDGAKRTGASELARRGLLDKWVARAEWLEQEAKAQRDTKVQGRTLLAASELWAMAGNRTHARELASQAAKLVGGAAQRQARQLAAVDRDFEAASRLLSAEAHSAGTPAARSHAAFYNAEIERLELHNGPASMRHFEQGGRTQVGDPRGTIARLCSQLATSPKPPSVMWPEGDDFKDLVLATRAISLLRGDTRWPSAELSSVTPAVAFVDAQRALERGDRVKAAKALVRLSEVDGFRRSAKWLAASLLAPVAATRGDAVRLLSEMLQETEDSALRRALAERAVESGDGVAAQAALAGSSDEGGFSAADRVAIGTLSGADPQTLRPQLEELAKKDDMKPLAFAIAVASGIQLEAAPSDDPEVALLLSLGRAMGEGQSPEQIEALIDGDVLANHPLRPLFKLESAARKGDAASLAHALTSWSDDGGGESAEERLRQAHLAAGLLHEISGAAPAAESHYAQALSSKSFGEAATRALFAFVPPERLTKLLSALADTADDAERRALLLLEAALRSNDSDEQKALLENAHELAPQLPFAAHLSERLGMNDESAESALVWLGVAREQCEDDFEHALLLVREALLSAGDMAQAQALMDSAWEHWPKDVALLELWERLNPVDSQARAEARERLAKALGNDSSRARLLLEAAWFHEQANQPQEAARCAKLAISGEPELAQLVYERNAAATKDAAELRDVWAAELQGEVDPDDVTDESLARLKHDECIRLAAFERQSGSLAQARHWLVQALRYQPKSLRALLLLEQAQLEDLSATGVEAELADTEQRLASRLSPQDGVAHALLAARLKKQHSGWPSAYDSLKQADQTGVTSLFVQRQVQAQALRAGDDATYYAVTLQLTEKLAEPLDQAVSLLRASEAATRLNRPVEAISHLTRAAELAPEHLVVHSHLADLLEQQGEFAQAAKRYRILADTCRVTLHRVQALRQAARIWLDELDDVEDGADALRAAFDLDPTNKEVSERLLSLFAAGQRHLELIELVKKRLRFAADDEERVEIQVLQARTYMQLGQTDAAKEVLEKVLALKPEHAAALGGLAELARGEGDANSSEQALLQLVRLNKDAGAQADVYLQLAALYTGPLENLERAERAYQEVLKRRPKDRKAFDALLPLYVQMGEPQRAVDLLGAKLQQADGVAEKRSLQLKLVQVQDELAGDTQAAEAALSEALGSWPLDREVLLAAAAFYRKHDRQETLTELAQRTSDEVKRKLQSGLISAELTEALQTLASIAGDGAREEVAATVTCCLKAEPAQLKPAGARAMARKLDDDLAAPPISSALRTLLMQTRGMLDEAFPVDPARYDAVPLEPGTLLSNFENKARATGVAIPKIFVSRSEGKAWVVGGATEPRVVLGSDLAGETEPVQDFIVWRSLKLIQARACALARLDGEELNAAVIAFLACFVPTDPSTVATPALYESMSARISPLVPGELDDDIPVLAMEVAGRVVQHSSSLGLAVRKWANRCALLATGDLSSALSALALAHGLDGLPSDVNQRTGWIAGNQETRDLICSCSNDGFVRSYAATAVRERPSQPS